MVKYQRTLAAAEGAVRMKNFYDFVKELKRIGTPDSQKPTWETFAMKKYLRENPTKPYRTPVSKKKLRQVGKDKNSKISKTRVIPTNSSLAFDAVLQCNTRTLYGFEITKIPQFDVNAAGQDYLRGTRMYTEALIKGFKLNMEVLAKDPDRLMMMNWAVIAPKTGRFDPTNVAGQPYTWPDIMDDGFFRSYGATSRDVNFTNSLSSVIINYNPISTDQYLVLKHERMVLGADGSGAPGTNDLNIYTCPSNSRSLNLYVPINRKIVYNDDVSTDAEEQLLFIFWFDFQFAQPAATPSPAAVVQARPITYFGDVNSCC